ncbi:MAG: hypothetical protein ACKODK_00985, partial [Opitutaceae bacterium]
MAQGNRQPPAGGAFSRRFASYAGLFFDEFEPGSAWIRETAEVRLPPLEPGTKLIVRGHTRPHPEARGIEVGTPGLRLALDGASAGTVPAGSSGPWELAATVASAEPAVLVFSLEGASLTNLLAWAGRVTGFGPWQRFRAQNRNRQLRVETIATADGEVIFDFSQRAAPFSAAFARRHARLGLNIVGFLTADLGVGESARCMVRAADAAGLPSALVPLRLNCRNRLGDDTYAARLGEENPHGVNVFHVDPPAAQEIDHHHGTGFRAG